MNDEKVRDAAYTEALEKIKKAKRQRGPYTHNLIGLILSRVANEQSADMANRLILDAGLSKLGFKVKK